MAPNESYHWFDYLYYNDHRKNKLRLWLINARDAGFTHAYLDMSRSKNIATPKEQITLPPP